MTWIKMFVDSNVFSALTRCFRTQMSRNWMHRAVVFLRNWVTINYSTQERTKAFQLFLQKKSIWGNRNKETKQVFVHLTVQFTFSYASAGSAIPTQSRGNSRSLDSCNVAFPTEILTPITWVKRKQKFLFAEAHLWLFFKRDIASITEPSDSLSEAYFQNWDSFAWWQYYCYVLF